METFILYYILISVGSIYGLWIFYLAVMNLAKAQQNGTLSKTALVLGYPVLIVGIILDIFVNWFIMTIVLVEFPKELTVSARLKRLNTPLTSKWRLAVVKWIEPLLDPYDPRGDHI